MKRKIKSSTVILTEIVVLLTIFSLTLGFVQPALGEEGSSTFVDFYQLEKTSGVGRFLSLDVDQQGNPQASYIDGSLLRHARFTGYTFEFEDVASDARYNSLALDPSDIAKKLFL